jgi:hypothetical protein
MWRKIINKMGQFIETIDEKGRFCNLYYDIQANGTQIATVYCFSTKRQEQHKSTIPYENLRLLALAQDMAQDFGMELFVSGTLEKKIDE